MAGNDTEEIHSTSLMNLDVDPSVVFKLGEDLITDDAQAVTELIKNSYDADARIVRVDIDTIGLYHRATGRLATAEETDAYDRATFAAAREKAKAGAANQALERERREPKTNNETNQAIVEPSAYFEQLAQSRGSLAESQSLNRPKILSLLVRGRLSVSDDGSGMDLEVIRTGWLTISASRKKTMKAQGLKTAGQRTPLGDKGLGRLGVQRLGELVRVTSVPAETTGSQLGDMKKRPLTGTRRVSAVIDWAAIAAAKALGNVPITVSEDTIAETPAGTSIDVFGLFNLPFWAASESEAFDRELMSIISPYDDAQGYEVVMTVNGTGIDLRRRAREILKAAPIAYSFTHNQGQLTILGRISSTVLRGNTFETRRDYDLLIAPDNGYAFAEWLISTRAKRAAEVNLQLGDDRHFVFLSDEETLDDLAAHQKPGEPELADPGSFTGEVSSVDLSSDVAPLVYSNDAEYRRFARSLVGIKVYRNGFGIRLADDWLDLSSRWTKGTSYYNLRPNNTLGFINLTAEDNSALEETTSREQFRDTPAWQGFYALMTSWAAYTERAQTFLRRSYNDYRKERETEIAVLPPDATPAVIAANVSSRLTQAQNSLRKAQSARQELRRIDTAVQNLRASQKTGTQEIWSNPKLDHAIVEASSQIDEARLATEKVFSTIEPIIREYESLHSALHLLEEQMTIAQTQIADAWESVAAGLSAETLSHEVEQISDRLRGRSAQVTAYLKSQSPPDTRLLSFTSYVRSAAGELTRQVSRLNPSLRFRRERKSLLSLSSVLEGVAGYHESRWQDGHIQIAIDTANDFSVRANEGKLTQIFDNLILNSEYWIRHAIRRGQAMDGTITLTVDAPYVSIADTGPGLDPAVSTSLFDPFVTTKPNRDGRGLGLFIVSQLLESDGCSIVVVPDRNPAGRLYKFRLDFSALTTGDES